MITGDNLTLVLSKTEARGTDGTLVYSIALGTVLYFALDFGHNGRHALRVTQGGWYHGWHTPHTD